MKDDHSEWLTKARAAEIIGVSTKTIEKIAADGQLQQAQTRRAGKPPIVVYHPADVERVRKERNPDGKPFVIPDSKEEPETLPVVAAPPVALSAFAGLMNHLGQPRVRLSERLYLTVKEAAEFTGLTQALLMRKIESRELPALKDVSWKIRRSELEKL